jgi:ribosomal protein L37E
MASTSVIACARCGTSNFSNRTGCLSCGAQLPADEKTQGAKWWGDIDSDSLGSLAIYIGCVVAIPLWIQGKWDDLGILVRIYLAGMFFLWVFFPLWFFANFIRTFSIYDRNMARIGMRRNIFIGLMQEKQSVSYSENIWFATINVLITSLMSWLIFPVEAYRFLKRLAYRWRMPRALKELDWTLKHHQVTPLDVARFDAKMAETLLGRRLTQDECDSRQQQLDRNGIDVKMTEVMALTNGEGISERPHSRYTTKTQPGTKEHVDLTDNMVVSEPLE